MATATLRFSEPLPHRRGDRRHWTLTPLVAYVRALVPGMVVALVLVIAMGAAYLGYSSLNRPVSKVSVMGEYRHLDTVELQKVVTSHAGAGFFGTDLDALRKAIEELPWVNSAVVSRKWPDQLQVLVFEQQVAAAWGQGSYLNQQGEVFTPKASVALAGVPQVVAPPGTEKKVLAILNDMGSRFSSYHFVISALSYDAKGALEILLDNGIRLYFGSGEFDQKMQRFLDTYRVKLAEKSADIAYVDLRYANGLAVGWKSPE